MKYLAIVIAALALTACATPQVTQVNQINDVNLTCSQIKTEIAEAKKLEDEARKERKVTGKNVAAAVFFWPALVVTHMNADEAITAAKDRQEMLTKLYQQKGCR